MRLRRPSEPRLVPIEAVAADVRERMASQPAQPANVMATVAHNPAVAEAVQRFAGTLFARGLVSPRQRELAILRIGWDCQSEYEFGQHTLFALDVGITADEIELLTRPLSAGSWSDADRAVLQMVDDLAADDCVGDLTWNELTTHFTAAQKIELIAITGYYRLVCELLTSCGVALEDGVPGWPTITRARTDP